jgi:hypothetical protein
MAKRLVRAKYKIKAANILWGSKTPITLVTCGFGRVGRRPETGQSRPLEGPPGAPAREPNVDEV